MAQIFPRWTNKTPVYAAAALIFLTLSLSSLIAYYASPRFTDVGYRPNQPVAYSHKLHAGDLGMDCRYCHSFVEMAAHANVPPTQTCMNCHSIVGTDNDKLLPVRESWALTQPIDWIRVHKNPDYAYFDHSIHLYAGVGCVTCHGNIAQMIVVGQSEPLNMGWCLSCHRHPDPHLRPQSALTDMQWQPDQNHAEFVQTLKNTKQISPPVDCSTCHR